MKSIKAVTSWRPTRWHLAEALLVGCSVPLYYLARGSVHIHVSDAFQRSIDLIDLEHRLGLLWEQDMQRWVLPHDWLVDILNGVYLWGHLPVIGIVAFWLYLRHRPQYLLMRNAFLISGAIGLVVYFLYPVAPPRLMPAWGFVDTIWEQYGVGRPGTPSVFVNDYAAVPSLHFGWNLLAGLMAWWAFKHVLTLVFAVAMPLVTLASIVLTANHFFLDALAGTVAVAAGIAIALALRRLAHRRIARGNPGSDGGWGWLFWVCGVAEPAEGARVA